MSLQHILLGFLREPASGYDLKRKFESSAAYFWSAELSQIYPTLKRMEAAGLLESWWEPSDQGPDRKIHRTLPPGREALKGWLEAGPSRATERLEYVAQLFFLGELGSPDATGAFVEALRERLEARRSDFEAFEEEIRARGGPVEEMDDETFHRFAALRLGQRVVEARLAWCRELLDLLDRSRMAPAGPREEHAHAPSTGSSR